MRKITDDDTRLIALIAGAGGSVCPGADISLPKAAKRLLRRLALRGDLATEETQDGVRFTLTPQGWSNAS